LNLSSSNSLNGVEKSIDFDCIEDNVLRQDKEQDEKIGVEDKGKLNNGFEKCFDFDDGSRAKSVLIVGFKVFVVVALALSTKKLAVGITMSAFALLFLEYAGKHLACLHSRCSKTLMWFDSMIQSVSLFMKRNSLFCKKGIVREKLVILDESDSNGLICGVELTSSIEEIECIESESSPNVDKQVEEITTEFDKRLEHRRSFVESEHGDEVGNRSWRWHGKSINIGSKFVKKLVPKKLRSSKEYCKDKERYPCSGQFVCAKSLDIENHEKLYQELSRCPSDVLNNKLLESSEDGSSCCEAVEASGNSTGGESPSLITTRDSKRYSNSGMGILVLVVLAGLGWGRLLSLVVTVAGYSIAAFVEKLRRDQTSNFT
jgi:hypothetical protein